MLSLSGFYHYNLGITYLFYKMESVEEIRRSTRTLIKKEFFEQHHGKSNNKWTEEEQQIILKCLKIYGHKATDKMIKQLRSRTVEDVRHFLLLAHCQARRNNEIVSGIEYWLERTKAEMKKTDTCTNNYLYMPAQVIKYLSIDGLLENHPKPEYCGEIDFMAAYRLIYQALMGYPLQPVNQATADFISENLNDILSNKSSSLVNELSEFMKKKFTVKEEPVQGPHVPISNTEIQFNSKKPLVVYNRKRPFSSSNPDSLNETNLKPLQVVCEENGPGKSGNSKFYSVSIKGKDGASPVAVPVPAKITKAVLECAASSLWENQGFNPLGLTQANFKKHIGNQIQN